MYVKVRVRVPFRMWLEVTRYALLHRIHPVLIWSLLCEHGYGIICDKD